MNSDFNTWLISEASKPYESKMLQLVGGDETRRCELKGRLLSGIEHPHVLMYQIDVLHSHDGHRAYEFLIEYNTYDPSTGIYYGCKGFTNKQYSHPTEVQQFRKEYNTLKNELLQKLNRKFLGKDFTHRLLTTDNTDSNTYWLFWIRLEAEENICKVALPATHLIRDFFAKRLNLIPSTTQSSENQPTTTSFYKQLLDKCIYAPAYDHSELFSAIISHLETDGILQRETEETDVWRFIGVPKHDTKADFARLMHIIFTEYIHPMDVHQDKDLKLIPWKLIRTVFLDKDGNAFKDNIRTQWQYIGKTDDKNNFWQEKIASYIV